MKIYLRYSLNIEKDIERGVSYHYSGLDRRDYRTTREASKALGLDASEVVFNKDSKTYAQVLPGLCVFELESDNLEDAIEEAKQFRHGHVYNSNDMPYWHILSGSYTGDCPEGDVINDIELLYSNEQNKL